VLQETNPTIHIMMRESIIPVKPKLMGSNNITLPTIQFTTANTDVYEEFLLLLIFIVVLSLFYLLLVVVSLSDSLDSIES